MAKGLPYSTARGIPGTEPLGRKRIKVNTTVTVAAAGAGVGFGTAVVGDFPEGNIVYCGGTCYLSFTTADTDLTTTWDGSFGLGTTADADGTLATTEFNLMNGTIAAATNRTSSHNRGASNPTNSPNTVFDNTDGSLEVNLNVVVDAADITDAQSAILTVTGHIDLFYAVSGDD